MIGSRPRPSARLDRIWAGDRLPGRFTGEPSPSGNARGEVIDLAPMLNEYYALRGGDVNTGVPQSETLRRLGLGALFPCA